MFKGIVGMKIKGSRNAEVYKFFYFIFNKVAYTDPCKVLKLVLKKKHI